MISNLAESAHKRPSPSSLPEVYQEVAITRKELGTRRLVTPTSQNRRRPGLLKCPFGQVQDGHQRSQRPRVWPYEKPRPRWILNVQKKVLKGIPAGETRSQGVLRTISNRNWKGQAKIGNLAKTISTSCFMRFTPLPGSSFEWKYGLNQGRLPSSRRPWKTSERRRGQAAAPGTCCTSFDQEVLLRPGRSLKNSGDATAGHGWPALAFDVRERHFDHGERKNELLV